MIFTKRIFLFLHVKAQVEVGVGRETRRQLHRRSNTTNIRCMAMGHKKRTYAYGALREWLHNTHIVCFSPIKESVLFLWYYLYTLCYYSSLNTKGSMSPHSPTTMTLVVANWPFIYNFRKNKRKIKKINYLRFLKTGFVRKNRLERWGINNIDRRIGKPMNVAVTIEWNTGLGGKESQSLDQ